MVGDVVGDDDKTLAMKVGDDKTTFGDDTWGSRQNYVTHGGRVELTGHFQFLFGSNVILGVHMGYLG